MNKEESRINMIKGIFAEDMVYSYFNSSPETKVIRLMKAKRGNELDIEGVREFLKGYDLEDKALELLKQLNYEKLLLPDFCVICKDEFCFMEVKHRKDKIKLANIEQKKSIKRLLENDFEVHIVNVEVDPKYKPTDTEENIELALKEQGMIMKGEDTGYNCFLEDKIKITFREHPIHKKLIFVNFFIEEMRFFEPEKKMTNDEAREFVIKINKEHKTI